METDGAQQRGIRMAFTNLAVFGGAFFTPIVVGKITNSIGWWWTFYLVAIFCAACIPLVYFFCPETAYRRDTALNLDLLDTGNAGVADKATGFATDDAEKTGSSNNGEASGSTEIPPNPHTNGATSTPTTNTPPKATFRQSLALFNGRKTDESFWKLLLRPFPLFFHPAFLWACLIQGLMIGWTVFIGVILAQFFLATPLWWGEVKTGYAYTAAFIGAILGFVIAGALSDWSARAMTKWNGGVYEPEFRIVLVIPQMILGCAGLYGWGITVDGLLHSTYHYAVPLTFFALEVAGMVIGAVASSLYIVDAYRTSYWDSSSVWKYTYTAYRRPRHRGLHVHDRLQEHLQLWPDPQGFRVACPDEDQGHSPVQHCRFRPAGCVPPQHSHV